MKSWWVSWWGANGAFEYHGPWWISGEREDGLPCFCAAVRAKDEAGAKRVIEKAHDPGCSPGEWRFVSVRLRGWEPFSDRFPRADWMKWPWPERT